jgi:hypothetical protein
MAEWAEPSLIPSLSIVLKGLKVIERGYFMFYTKDLFPNISDVQEPAP